MFRHGAVAFPLLLALSAAGFSAESDSWYLDLGLGAGVAPDMRLNDAGASAEFDLGFPLASLAFGRTFGAWRVELETGTQENTLENYFWPTGDDVVRADADDSVSSRHLMLNGIRQFQIGALRPYLGLGLGAASTGLTMSREATIWPTQTPRVVHIDDEATSFAWQAMIGFDVPLSARWDLGFDYRYWRTGNVAVTAESGESLDVDHKTHSARVHVRYFLADTARRPGAGTPTPSDNPWHLSASFGAGWAIDSEFSDTLDNLDAFALGGVYTLSLERRLSRRWALGVEASWRQNDLEVIDFGDPIGEFGASGEVTATSLILNAFYGFRPARAIRPYLGAGIGLARVKLKAQTLGEEYLDDEEDAPAAQLIGGAHIALSERIDFLAEFRTWYAAPIDIVRPDGRTDETWHWVHSVQLGLRYAL